MSRPGLPSSGQNLRIQTFCPDCTNRDIILGSSNFVPIVLPPTYFSTTDTLALLSKQQIYEND